MHLSHASRPTTLRWWLMGYAALSPWRSDREVGGCASKEVLSEFDGKGAAGTESTGVQVKTGSLQAGSRSNSAAQRREPDRGCDDGSGDSPGPLGGYGHGGPGAPTLRGGGSGVGHWTPRPKIRSSTIPLQYLLQQPCMVNLGSCITLVALRYPPLKGFARGPSCHVPTGCGLAPNCGEDFVSFVDIRFGQT